MSPRSPSSLSEGEIVSGDEEKAINTTARASKDNMVNKSTRLPPNGSSSRSARPIENLGRPSNHRHRDDDRSRQRRDRSRSRSPYRRERSRDTSQHHADTFGIGSKRAHDDDHYSRRNASDPRRFKVHYEDREPSRRAADISRRSYVDSDRPSPSARRTARDRDGQMDRGNTYHGRQDQSNDPRNPAVEEHNGSRTAERSSILSSEAKFSPSHDKSPSDPSQLINSAASRKASPTADAEPDAAAVSHQQELPEVTLSEAELIEQRRKRREAIKARHKNTQPLLVQAIEQNLASVPSTPVNEGSPESFDQQSPPSSFNSPSTPHRDTPPGSPAAFAVSNDEELVDMRQAHLPREDDGPSAADYDPNMDMQEDRPDHKRQELPLDANGIPAETADISKNPKQSKEFDMFADDDDDDDMFAPSDRTSKPTAAKQARALDQSLLDNWDYPDGHYRIILGELLDGRYAVQQQIGKGTFATVVRATDTRDGSAVAVKIACNNDTMYKAGQKEMDMLSLLNQNDPDDKKHIIRLVRHFEHKGHLCLVFESLSADLREVLKKFGRNVGLNLKAIRSYAQQMFLALSHMKKCQILHADLKPDNMLVSEKRSILKICDLGTASFADDAEVTPYLVSRFYRAPEVILGIPFDYAIDMWSIGCTLFELYTGRILYAGADNNQMLRAIQECRGKFPLRMLKRATLVDKHFDAAGTFYSQERDKITGKPTVRPMNYNKTAPGRDLRARLSGNLKGMSADEIKEHASFVDLMDKCLQLDPARRVTPNEALRHSFVTHGIAASQPGDKRAEPVRVAMNIPRKR